MHNFTLSTGQNPHTHNTQSGATSVMPTGQHFGLSVLLMHCTSQTLQALTRPNPAHAPFLSIKSSSPVAHAHSIPVFILKFVTLSKHSSIHPYFLLLADPALQPHHHNSPFSILYYHIPHPVNLFTPCYVPSHSAFHSTHHLDTTLLFRFLSINAAIPYLQAFLPMFSPNYLLSLTFFPIFPSLTCYLPMHVPFTS